jgi:ribosomal protein L23
MLKLGDLLNLVKYPSLTEKSILYGDRQYTFIVDRSLTKHRLNILLRKLVLLLLYFVFYLQKTRRVGKFVGKRPLYKKTYVKLKREILLRIF